ncbi:GGDEF domain-containing response regulator [Vibrio panuliri]|uniref:diguanylate cyclase n=1 Tax=Vibrio panuliri TaxID=1381081 RepID=A0ABX3FEQ7_9VIBR|nr:diguanylate cyclase [Vibrio panuliri]KAB1453883.1 diguanylate cyclase [Vibrio panuliri]OLQ87865.1 diguanylate cyclase response regulator [Vibrio panuliri]
MTQRPSVLIVDDRPENLIALEVLLESFDVDIVRASCGEEALAHTLDHQFALVLLDVQMPGMDGYEVAELLRGNKKTKTIPIIFVTARSKNETQVFRGYESGAVDYMFKPLEPVVFRGKVRVFIELYEQREALRRKTIEFDQKLAELEELQQQLEETNEQLLMLSTTDSLTGLYNRRRFEQIFAEEWERASRAGTALSLIMLDIDHFKLYNDTFGHHLGDDCLRTVAKALQTMQLRELDRVARVGGEEFAIVLPDTEQSGAELVAEKVRNVIAELQIPHNDESGRSIVTASLGVSSIYPNRDLSRRYLAEAADEALYESKSNNRNCVTYKACITAQEMA